MNDALHTRFTVLLTMARRGILLFFVLMFSITGMWSQSNQQNNHWYFGEYAGIGFTGVSAGALTGSNMLAPEGTATISNDNGALLYYSNGLRVWGANHQIITNGDNLAGNPGSTQSVLFVPHPTQTRETYLFTTDADGGPNGLRYSLIRRSTPPDTTILVLGNQKNILLRRPVTERLTLVRHCNLKSYWVIAHEWGSNRFLAYLVDDDGLDTVPVVTATGPSYDGAIENGIGYMKPSPNDDLLAIAVTGSNRVDIFSFDNLHGEPTFLYSIPDIFQPYGVEFSELQEYLYVSGLDGRIYQFNLTSPNVPGSMELIASSGKLTGALQMGRDGIIYIAREMDYYLGYIGAPNNHGLASQYVENGIYLNGNRSKAGLPPHIPILEHFALGNQTMCLGDTAYFDDPFLLRVDSFIFYFGDRSTGIYDSTTQIPAWHIFTEYGYNPVELIYYLCGEPDTLTARVCVNGAPVVNLGKDSAVCENVLYTVSAFLNDVHCPSMPITYSWNTGQSDAVLNIYPPGTYSVTVTNQCGSGSDSVEIFGLPVPPVSLGPDQTLCIGDTAILIPYPTPDSLMWFDGTNDPFKLIDTTGNYFVAVTNEFLCRATASVYLEFLEPPNFEWDMRDTTICIGHPMELAAEAGFDSYLWQDGSTGTAILIADSGWYYVFVSNLCGTDSDSLYVHLEDCRLKLYVPNAFTPNGDGINDEFRAYGLYVDDFRLFIYNRWGAQVFVSENLEKGWDGTINGTPAPQGVYVYHIIYRDATNKTHHLNGTVTLIRR